MVKDIMSIDMIYQAGVYRQQKGYKAFLPSNLLNNQYIWNDERIVPALAEAMHALGALDAYAQLVPDSSAFLELYIAKEAVTSSRIEGTKTNVEEALLPPEEIAGERRDDYREVRNYMDALTWATDELKRLPLSMRVLKGAHRVLMQGVRGEGKLPGEVRTSQNWIGGPAPATARFVPPPFAEVPDLLTDLERYWHSPAITTPALIRTAMSHYQFETIHPFLDGNGRTGRLLITLHLMHEQLLTTPVLYLSAYLEEHRQEYFDCLERVRTHGEMDQWVLFFLAGVAVTAKSAKDTMQKITVLHKKYADQITSSFGKRTPLGHKFLTYLFSHPTLQVKDVISAMNVTKPTAHTLVDQFVGAGILKETTGKEKNRIFSFQEYIALFDSQPSL